MLVGAGGSADLSWVMDVLPALLLTSAMLCAAERHYDRMIVPAPCWSAHTDAGAEADVEPGCSVLGIACRQRTRTGGHALLLHQALA